jgi:hypothetical protein
VVPFGRRSVRRTTTFNIAGFYRLISTLPGQVLKVNGVKTVFPSEKYLILRDLNGYKGTDSDRLNRSVFCGTIVGH